MQPPPPAQPDRRADRVLGLIVAVLLVVAVVRSAGGRAGLRPTTPHPTVIATADLNHSDSVELQQVPGIGPRLADAIVAHRTSYHFGSVDDLLQVKGIGPATVDKLRPWVSVEPPAELPKQADTLERKPPAPPPTPGMKLRPGDPPLDVNAASETELQRLPGVGPTIAGRIVLARGTERFKSVEELRRVKGIGPKTLENLRPFVVCRPD